MSRRRFVLLPLLLFACAVSTGRLQAQDTKRKDSKSVRVKEPLEAPPIASRVGSSKPSKVLFTLKREGTGRRIFEIHALDEDGKNIKRLSKADGLEYDAAFSPDGKRIAFVEATGKRGRQPKSAIVVMNADGSDRKQLIGVTGVAIAPAWSPDGKRIAFNVLDGPPAGFITKIYFVDADGKNRTELCTGAFPSWASDGKRIVYTAAFETGQPTLQIRTVDGGEPKQLIKGAAMMAAWSPDGKRIAYISMDDGLRDIFVVNPDGTDRKQLTKTKDHEVCIRWSVDGKRILFSRLGTAFADQADIFSIDLDGKNEKRLTRGKKGKHLLTAALVTGRVRPARDDKERQKRE